MTKQLPMWMHTAPRKAKHTLKWWPMVQAAFETAKTYDVDALSAKQLWQYAVVEQQCKVTCDAFIQSVHTMAKRGLLEHNGEKWDRLYRIA